MLRVPILMLLSACFVCSVTHADDSTKAIAKTLQGTNPKGDTVVWPDGSIWQFVTVQSFKLEGKDTKIAKLKIGDVPKGYAPGWFTNFTTASFRGEISPPPKRSQATISAGRLFTPGYSPKSLDGLPPLRGDHQDMYLYVSRRLQDSGSHVGQFMTTVTHIVVKQGSALCLVRRNSKSSDLTVEGWYDDIDEVLFADRPTDEGKK